MLETALQSFRQTVRKIKQGRVRNPNAYFYGIARKKFWYLQYVELKAMGGYSSDPPEEQTMAVLSAAHTNYYSIVLEGNRKLYVKKTPMELIKTACLEGGASYDGRRDAVTYRTGIQRKVPIPINERKNIYAFPTKSPSQFGCHWIFPSHIRNLALDPYTKHGCLVIFQNNKILSIDVSIKSMERQIHRAAYCVCVFSEQCEYNAEDVMPEL